MSLRASTRLAFLVSDALTENDAQKVGLAGRNEGGLARQPGADQRNEGKKRIQDSDRVLVLLNYGLTRVDG